MYLYIYQYQHDTDILLPGVLAVSANPVKHNAVAFHICITFIFYKGIDIFCEAITRNNLNGIVIGDGPLKEKYKKEYPQINFIGWIDSDKIESYLEEVRCLIVTSKWYETMGLTIIEMQSKGIPCITPNEFAGNCYIENDITGLSFDINSIESLDNAIKKTLNDNYLKEMSVNFYERLDKEKFSIDTHISNLLKIYEEKEDISCEYGK